MKTILSKYPLSLLSVLMLCASFANGQDDIRRKPLVLPTPSDSQYTVERNVVYRDSEEGRTLADVFLPSDSDGKHPLSIFVHGGGGSKDLGQMQSFAAHAAAKGMAAMAFTYRLDSLQLAASDTQAAVDFIRNAADEYSIDKDRICLWFFSTGGNFLAPFLAEQPEWLKCTVLYYGAMGPDVFRAMGAQVSEADGSGLEPLPLLANSSDWKPAMFIAEAGTDHEALNAALRHFAQSAASEGWPVEYWNHPAGPHAFDILQDDQRSRAIIQRSLDFAKDNLQK